MKDMKTWYRESKTALAIIGAFGLMLMISSAIWGNWGVVLIVLGGMVVAILLWSVMLYAYKRKH